MEDNDDLSYEQIVGEFSFLMAGGQFENWMSISEGDKKSDKGETIDISDLPPEVITLFYRKLRQGKATVEDIERLRKICRNLDLFTQWAANVLTTQILYEETKLTQ